MAAGLGTRMRSATPKHLHPLLGRRMVDWVTGAARTAGADPVVIVVSEETQDAFPGETTAVQRNPRGTGDAAASARAALEGFEGDVLVAVRRHAAAHAGAPTRRSSRRTAASGRP